MTAHFINMKSAINSQAAQLIRELEGVNGVYLLRAKERAMMYDDFSEFNLLIAKKELVRKRSNEDMKTKITLSGEEAKNYQLIVDLNSVTTAITRITLGAFWRRVTDSEYTKLTTDIRFSKTLEEFRGRKYVDLVAKSTKADLEVLGQLNILSAVIDVDKYATRLDELLREGEVNEAYNITI
jgi:hypothetical protein